ncbi:FlgO family outer membrane protein [uncultured Croceitalea sp.]|uniref:FlgO family outer membrane protein n=1 Tax=uncultured Croceitalea sp. TaxID=1798908 RepID=UPI0033056E9D
MNLKTVLTALVIFPLILTAQHFDSGLESLAEELAEKLNEKEKTKVAIWGFFTESDKHEDFGSYLTEDFSIYLGNYATNFGIIDRPHLKVILKEHRLIADGLIDEKTTKKLGKISAADAIIVGTYTILDNKIKIRVRILDTETALQIGGVMRALSMNDDIAHLLGKL